MWPVGDPKQSLHALSELKALFAAPDAVMTLQDATEADWQAAMRRFAENEQAIPAVVAMPASADEVSAVVKYAVLRNIAFAVKCGGHDAAPPQTVGGMVIDLSRLKGIRFSDDKSLAYIAGGSKWGDVYPACDAQQRTVVGGGSHTVGVGGYLTSAGMSWIMGLYGYATDSVVQATVVLADGRQVTCSETAEAELFWAVRGGGVSMGIVTEFVVRTYEHVGGHLYGTLHYSGTRFQEVLAEAQNFSRARTARESLYLNFGTTPDGQPEIFILLWIQADSPADAKGRAAMRPFWDLKPDHDFTRFSTTHEESSHAGDEAELFGPRRVTAHVENLDISLLYNEDFMTRLWSEFVEIVKKPGFEKSICFFELHDLRVANSEPPHTAAFTPAFRRPHMGFMLALKYDDASCDDYAQATVARHGQLIASMRDTASLPYYGLPLFAAREGDKLEDIFAESERLRKCKAIYDPRGVFNGCIKVSPSHSL